MNADAVTAHVAMSRFKTANDLIILQPFDLQAFQQGVPGQPTLLLKYLSLDNKGGIHDDLGDIQANLPSEQAAKRDDHRSKENRAASVQKAREKRSHEDMTLVLHKNKANMTAASKQKRSRVPKKQVQY